MTLSRGHACLDLASTGIPVLRAICLECRAEFAAVEDLCLDCDEAMFAADETDAASSGRGRREAVWPETPDSAWLPPRPERDDGRK
jgi:hypothetical protein